MIASISVQSPSVPSTAVAVLFTVMLAAWTVGAVPIISTPRRQQRQYDR